MKPNSDFERSRMNFLFVWRKINRIVLLGYKGYLLSDKEHPVQVKRKFQSSLLIGTGG